MFLSAKTKQNKKANNYSHFTLEFYPLPVLPWAGVPEWEVSLSLDANLPSLALSGKWNLVSLQSMVLGKSIETDISLGSSCRDSLCKAGEMAVWGMYEGGKEREQKQEVWGRILCPTVYSLSEKMASRFYCSIPSSPPYFPQLLSPTYQSCLL